MIKIKMNAQDDFLKIKETLTRMGIANNKDKVLYQSCHILQKRGEYFIAHFKDMMELDGKPSSKSDDDTLRTNSIAMLLESWGLLTVLDKIETPMSNNFRVISFKQKADWKLVPKYTIGK